MQQLFFSSDCCFRVDFFFKPDKSLLVLFPFLQVSLKDNGNLSKDSNVTMEIPTHTTIAYGLIELEVKQDGRYGETRAWRG